MRFADTGLMSFDRRFRLFYPFGQSDAVTIGQCTIGGGAIVHFNGTGEDRLLRTKPLKNLLIGCRFLRGFSGNRFVTLPAPRTRRYVYLLLLYRPRLQKAEHLLQLRFRGGPASGCWWQYHL